MISDLDALTDSFVVSRRNLYLSALHSSSRCREIRDFACLRFLIKTFWVTLLTDIERGIDKDLHKLARFQQAPPSRARHGTGI